MPRTHADVSVTPEAVLVTLDVAGLGSRMIALIVDSLIQAGILIATGFLVFNAASGTAAAVAFSLVAFFTLWGYFPLFEGVWSGRTPGKRAQGLRVIRTDGHPVTFAPVLVRNLVRIVDFLPSYYLVGLLCMVLTRRWQRLGDLAAGTMVVRERPAPAPTPLDLPEPGPDSPAAAMDTSALTEAEYSLVRSFLERRESLDGPARADLAGKLAGRLRTTVGSRWAEWLGDEAFLVAVAQSYRERFRRSTSRPGL
jgi:uncharacterized RDD family membrane protein YckC